MFDSTLIYLYELLRNVANKIAYQLEKRGYIGHYITPDNREGLLNPTTRPTRFEFRK